MELASASLEKICVDDEVRYTSKYWRTKTAELDSENMVVVKNGLTEGSNKTIKVYSRQDA